MRKKTIKYNIVDLTGAGYVALRLADYDYLVQSHQSMATDYDSLNLAITHLRALWITLCITVGPSEAEQPSSTPSNNH